MTVRNPVVYKCDFCSEETERPEAWHWFTVNGEKHACEQCGHGLMDLLSRLHIKYHKDCTLYVRHPQSTGTIDFDEAATVEISVVIPLAVKLRRPG